MDPELLAQLQALGINPDMLTPGPAHETPPAADPFALPGLEAPPTIEQALTAEASPLMSDPAQAEDPTGRTPEERAVAAQTVRQEQLRLPQGFARVLGTGELIPVEAAAAPRGGARGPGMVAQLDVKPDAWGADLLLQGNIQQQQGAAQSAMLTAEQALQSIQTLEDEAARDHEAATLYDEISKQHVDRANQEVQQLSGLLDAVQTGRIDPNRMWANRGEGARFGAMMSVAGGYMASVLTGTPTAAMSIITNAIDRDIHAQVADQQNLLAVAGERRNLIQTMREVYNDERTALLAVRAIKTQEAIKRLQALGAQFEGPQAMANLNNVVGQLNQQLVVQMNALLDNRLQMTLRGDPRLVAGAFQQEVQNRLRTRQGQQAPQEALQGAPGLPGLTTQAQPSAAPRRSQGAAQGTPAGAPQGGQFVGSLQAFNGSELAQHPAPAGYVYVETPQGVWLAPRTGAAPPDLRGIGLQARNFSPSETLAVEEAFATPPAGALPEGAHVMEGMQRTFNHWRNSERGASFLPILNDWGTIESTMNEIESYLAQAIVGLGPLENLTGDRLSAHTAALGLATDIQQIGRGGPSDAMALSELGSILEKMGGDPGTRINAASHLRAFRGWRQRVRSRVRHIAGSVGLGSNDGTAWNPTAIYGALPPLPAEAHAQANRADEVDTSIGSPRTSEEFVDSFLSDPIGLGAAAGAVERFLGIGED